MRGTNGKMTEDKVARTRSVMVKMPATMRAMAQEITIEKHSLTFQELRDYLQRNDTVNLAGDLGLPAFIHTIDGIRMKVDDLDESQMASAFEAGKVSAPRLSLLDTGAGPLTPRMEQPRRMGGTR